MKNSKMKTTRALVNDMFRTHTIIESLVAVTKNVIRMDILALAGLVTFPVQTA